MIDEDTIKKFLFRINFSYCKGDFYLSGIKRAYRDFNRTLSKDKDETQKQRDIKRNHTEDFLKNVLLDLISKDFPDQEAFDKEHEKMCESLKFKWNKLSIGQCQKWINMSLKYWVVFGESKIPGIEKNIKYFHIPIDSFIQQGPCKGLHKKHKSWSKLNDYKEYFDYQLDFRKQHTGKIPLVEEFIFFNETVIQDVSN